MNAEQRAIIALAEKEGVSPIEKDARLIVHGMVNATRDQMRKYQVGYDKMGEQQQDCVIADLTAAYNDLAITIARALASAGTPFVIATCKKLEVSNGNFTAIIKSDQDHYNDLISKVQDKGEVVIALYERQFRDGMDDIKADKDQKSLPLDAEPSEKPEKKPRASSGSATSAGALAKKAIELPPKLIEDARAFIIKNQVAKVSSLQNYLKINMGKAEALQKLFESEGLIEFIGTDASGEYEIVRKSAPTEEASESGAGVEESADLAPTDDEPVTELTDEIYAKIKAKVLETGKVSVGALSITFSLDDEIVEQAIDRLELEGVVSEENEMGLRSIIAAAE